MLHTPTFIPSHIKDRDVVDAEDAGQVYPPGGGLLFVVRKGTLPPIIT